MIILGPLVLHAANPYTCLSALFAWRHVCAVIGSLGAHGVVSTMWAVRSACPFAGGCLWGRGLWCPAALSV